jgi:cytochrome b6-f complex iron-sulfur subunit
MKKRKPSTSDKKEKEAGRTPADEPMTSRRTFFWKLWLALGGLAVLEYALAAADFLRPRRARLSDDDGAIVIAGPVDRFEPNTVAAFPKGKFYLARLEDGGFLALSRECTHLGCTVPWSSYDHAFVCPCHASSFDITGEVLSPPAPRALDLHPVRIENGVVKVDTSQRLKRRSFDPSQVTHA